MSFSYDVKNEINEILPKKDCCFKVLQNFYNVDKLQKYIEGKCCVKTFLRQAFIDYGTVNDPQNSYHLELDVKDDKLASLISVFMNDFNLDSKILLRSGSFVVYIKEADAIGDYLRLVGAGNALMEYENVRILKEVRGNINRKINCESGNIQKKIDAAFRQLESIEYIKNTVGLDRLPQDLKEVALIRLSDHNIGFEEIGGLLKNKIGKSGVSHRMKKIINIARKLKKEEE